MQFPSIHCSLHFFFFFCFSLTSRRYIDIIFNESGQEGYILSMIRPFFAYILLQCPLQHELRTKMLLQNEYWPFSALNVFFSKFNLTRIIFQTHFLSLWIHIQCTSYDSIIICFRVSTTMGSFSEHFFLPLALFIQGHCYMTLS